MYLLSLKIALNHLATRKAARLLMILSLSSLLLVNGYLVVLANNISISLSELSATRHMTVFVAPDVSEENISKVVSAIQKTQGVKSAEFISREVFLKKFSKSMPHAVSTLSESDAQAIPRYVAVQTHGEEAARAKSTLAKVSGVESVESTSDRFTGLVGALSGLRGLVIFMITAVSIALGSLAMSHFKHNSRLAHQMSQAYRGLGAKRFMLSLPFMIEGVVEGVAAGATAAVLFLITARLFESGLNQAAVAMGYGARHSALILPMSFAMVVLGAFIGVFGSIWVSARTKS